MPAPTFNAPARWLGAVMLTALLALAAWPASRAQAYVYWTNAGFGSVGRANLDGSGVNPSFIQSYAATGLAVDGSHIYWTTADTTYGLERANIDGSGATQSLITRQGWPYYVAAADGRIYWTNNNDATIGSANGDGTAIDSSPIPTHPNPIGVAVGGGRVYWTNSDTGVIGRANLDGTSATPTFMTGLGSVYGVAVDNGHIYWTINGGTTIGRANLDGSGVNQRFITGATNPHGLAVDGGHVYWANYDDSKGDNGSTIGRANLDGSGVDQSFITGAKRPEAVAVDGLGPQAGPSPSPSRLVLKIHGSSRMVLRSARSLVATFTCNVACTAPVSARATLDGRTVAKWSGSLKLAAGRSQRVRFVLTSTTYQRLRAALRGHRPVRLTVTAKARSTSGATATTTRRWVVARS